MITKDQLKKLFGNHSVDLHKYLNNKHKGGINNAKGNSLENHFAVFKIAEHFNKTTEHEHVKFSTQLRCFVDDLIIKTETNKEVEHYQIKDIKSLSWTSGAHPISDDFKFQHQICYDNGEKPALEIVVTSPEVKEYLEESMEDDLKEIVSVHHFPKGNSLPATIKLNTELKTALSQMCALNKPATDKLDTLASIVVGTWAATDQTNTSLKELLDRCYDANPHYIKGFDNRISAALEKRFSEVKGFLYSLEGGYITWSYPPSDSGVISARIGSKEFIEWENEIIQANPRTFEDLETYLI